MGWGTLRWVALAVVAALAAAARAPFASAGFGVVPIADCVTFDEFTNQLVVFWGYDNTNGFEVTIDTAFNFFVPGPSNREQLVTFEPGTHNDAFTTISDASGQVTWVLGEFFSTAQNDPSTYCSNTLMNVQPVLTGPASVAFGSVGVGTTPVSQTITVSNPDAANGHPLSSARVTGPYSVTGSTCFDGTGPLLAASSTCTVTVAFQPTVAGDQPGMLDVVEDDAQQPLAIPLDGAGLPTVDPSRRAQARAARP